MNYKQPPSSFTRLSAHATLLAFLLASLPLPALAGGSSAPLTGAEKKKLSEDVDEALGIRPATPKVPAEDASRRVPAEKDADTKDTDTKEPVAASATALCDPPKGKSKGGFGGMVESWPEPVLKKELSAKEKLQNSNYDRKTNAYIAERRKNLLHANLLVHKKYSEASNPQQPDLKNAVAAATAYFEIGFGRFATTVMVCEAKRQLAKRFEAFDEAKKQAAAITGKDTNSCEGAYTRMIDTYRGAEFSYNHLLSIIQKRQETGFLEKESGKRVEGLERAFMRYLEIHDKVKTNHIKKIEAAAKPDAEKINKEFEALWGKSTKDKPDPNSPYGELLLQLRQERKLAEEKRKWFSDNLSKHEELKERCGIASDAIHKPGGKDSQVTGKVPPPISEDTSAGSGRGTGGDGTGSDWTGGSNPPPPPSTPPTGGEGYDGSGGSAPPPKEKSGMSGFLKDNWMWLAGGAAVVGGGAYLYKRHQDKKSQKALDSDVAAYLAASKNREGPAPYVGGGGSEGLVPGSGVVPAGAKLIIETAIGNVPQGDTMSPIRVFLVDANGVPLKVNNVAIEAGCYVPQPCSLTGGKSVTTIDGAVTFDSLLFNMAHQGVRLQFSAPGVPTVTTPNTFDVTPTDVRRMETRDQIN